MASVVEFPSPPERVVVVFPERQPVSLGLLPQRDLFTAGVHLIVLGATTKNEAQQGFFVLIVLCFPEHVEENTLRAGMDSNARARLSCDVPGV